MGGNCQSKNYNWLLDLRHRTLGETVRYHGNQTAVGPNSLKRLPRLLFSADLTTCGKWKLSIECIHIMIALAFSSQCWCRKGEEDLLYYDHIGIPPWADLLGHNVTAHPDRNGVLIEEPLFSVLQNRGFYQLLQIVSYLQPWIPQNKPLHTEVKIAKLGRGDSKSWAPTRELVLYLLIQKKYLELMVPHYDNMFQGQWKIITTNKRNGVSG